MGRFVLPAVRRALQAKPYEVQDDALTFIDAAIEQANAALVAAADVCARYFATEQLRESARKSIGSYLRAFMDGLIHHITSKNTTTKSMYAIRFKATGLDFTRRNRSSKNGIGKWNTTARAAYHPHPPRVRFK